MGSGPPPARHPNHSMKLPENLRPFVIPAAWLASAALTFGLGRLTSFVDSGPETHVAGGTRPAPDAGSAFNPNVANGSAGEGATGGASRAHGTVEELTGGKPLDEWLKHLLGQEDEIARMSGFMMLLEKVNTPADFELALNTVLQNGNGGGRNREYSMLLQKWAKLDPKSAMAYVQEVKDNGAKFGGMNTVLTTWARTNPQEAIAWAKANGVNPEGREGDGNWALSAVIAQLAKSDLGQALQLAQGEPQSRARGRMVDTLVSQLISQKGLQAARDAAMGMTDEALRNGMIRQLAGRMASDDPQKTVAWLSSLPAGETKNSALADAVAQWAQKDAVAAAAYMTTLPAGLETDEPRARFARSVVRTDPAGALAWSASITDPEARARSLTDVVGSWMRRDADAAKQWVATSTLPEETKTQILAATAAPRGPGGPGGGGQGAGFQGRGGNNGRPATAGGTPQRRGR